MRPSSRPSALLTGDLSFKLDGLRTRNRVPYENVDLDMTESGTISLIVTWEADEQSLSI